MIACHSATGKSGRETRRESTALTTVGIDAIRGDRSYSFGINLFENDHFLRSLVDNVCIEDFERECDFCVDRFPTNE